MAAMLKFDDNSDSECSTCCSAGESPVNAPHVHTPTSNGPETRTSSWCLVWCHERCYKQECSELRRALGAATQEAGANFKCLRKANQFVEWCVNQSQFSYGGCGQLPYVLLTDWREVKQSLTATSQYPLSEQPVATVILCKEAKQYNRALRWTQTLPDNFGQVYVTNGIDNPKAFINSLIPGLRGSTTPAVNRPTKQPKSLQSNTWGKTEGPQQPASTHLAVKTDGMNKVQKPFMMMNKVQKPFMSATTQKVADTMRLPWPVVEAMLRVWGPYGSAAAVERLLLEAMPDHYDD